MAKSRVRQLKDHIAVLEQRKEYLGFKIDRFLGSQRSLHWMRSEYFALEFVLEDVLKPALQEYKQRLVEVDV